MFDERLNEERIETQYGFIKDTMTKRLARDLMKKGFETDRLAVKAVAEISLTSDLTKKGLKQSHGPRVLDSSGGTGAAQALNRLVNPRLRGTLGSVSRPCHTGAEPATCSPH